MLVELNQSGCLDRGTSAAAVGVLLLSEHERTTFTAPPPRHHLRGPSLAAPPSARCPRLATDVRVDLGHQQTQRISRRSNQLSTSEAEADRAVTCSCAATLTPHVHGYSRMVLQPHQTVAVHSQNPVTRSQLLTLSRRRTWNHRLDVNSAHLQLSFLKVREKDEALQTNFSQISIWINASPSRPRGPGPAREVLCAAPR